MLETLGVIIILVGIVLLILRPFLSEQDVYTTRTNMRGQEERVLKSKASHPLLLAINKKVTFLIIGVGVLFVVLPGIFFYAEPGKAYAVQYPWGTQKAVLSQGISTKFWGKLIPIQQEISIKDVLPNTDLKKESEFTYIQPAVEREFSDAVKATVANSIVIALDITDPNKFLIMATKNRTEANLVYSRIIPYRDAVLKNTAKLMSAQEYIAGTSAEFDRAFKDQLENGMYILEEIPFSQGKDTIGINKSRTIDENSKRRTYRIKTHKVGNFDEPLRNEGSLFKEYGLKVIQAVVNKIDWEDKFDERLDKQKQQVAETQLERQMTEKALIKTQRVYQEGESNKAEERARLEKEQIQKTIAAETVVKEEQFNLEASKIRLQKDMVEAQGVKVLADAESYKNSKLVNAGLTPQQKAEWEYKTKVGIAAEYSKITFPLYMNNYYGVGAGGAGGTIQSPLEALIGTAMAKQLIDNTVVPNKKKE